MKSIELFAGAGGLAIGTANAGLHHVALLELDRNACNTLRRNKRDGLRQLTECDIVSGDVSAYNFVKHRDRIEVVTGGPPCQPFSIGGKHRGHEDRRNMFPQAVRAIREIRPKAFMFENVKGLLRSSFANYHTYIIRQLEYPTCLRRGDEEWMDHLSRLEEIRTRDKFGGLRYIVEKHLMNAADWGVPQKRERVLMVGVRADLGIEFSFPARPTHTEDALLYQKWVTGEYWDRHRIPMREREKMSPRQRRRVERLLGSIPEFLGQPWRTVRDAISDLPRIAEGQTASKISNHYLRPGARSYAGHTGSPLDEPSKALKAGDHGVPGGENMLRRPDGTVRYFSVRECARLQTFPDNWTFEGSWTESMRQLGNAVPVKLAEVVATHMVHAIKINRHGRKRVDQRTA